MSASLERYGLSSALPPETASAAVPGLLALMPGTRSGKLGRDMTSAALKRIRKLSAGSSTVFSDGNQS